MVSIKLFGFGLIKKENYEPVQNVCSANSWTPKFCGFQTKTCFDINNCNASSNQTREIQSCYFTPEPTCSDAIKNCHDGSCEANIDCGGSCSPCPETCSDSIQNQGETGIDCGGPCPACVRELPMARNIAVYFFFAIFLALIALVIILIIRYYMSRKEMEKIIKKRSS